jgi:uncharacterized membrane protein YcaP (DUF421 family)
MDLVLRAIALYFFIYLLMRVVGRRELSGIEPFDLILLIVIGDAVQQGLTQDDYTVTGAILVVGTIAGLQVGLSYVGFKIPRLRPVLEGEPIILIENGKPIERNLRRERLALPEVLEEARGQQIAMLDEIQWAVLESSGTISFIKKS